ncbi:MAG: hypothetical protein NWF05_11080 [Candidatus Bathyarchaeota archaeon]|nr:hypothetical protein [Candidatus Bathyarchaeota archaeon]
MQTLADSHKTLMWLVGLNVALDLLSVPIWFAFSFMENPLATTIISVNTSAALADAFVAVIVFAVALFGLMKGCRWGAYLAVAGTVGQRVVGFYLFDVNLGMAVEFVWSSLIVFFSYKYIRQTQVATRQA